MDRLRGIWTRLRALWHRRWPDLPAINGFRARFLTAVRRLPGVGAAAIASASPLDAGGA